MKFLLLFATMMALTRSGESVAAENSPNDACRQRDSPACREFQEPRCQRDVEAWQDKSPAAREQTRERIERHRSNGVSACQTIYELNGGRDPCKYSFTDACRVEQQRRCQMAVDSFIDHVVEIDRSQPRDTSGRGNEVAEFRRRVAENRTHGITECETWSVLSRMAAGQ